METATAEAPKVKKEQEVINVDGLGEVIKVREGVFKMTNEAVEKFYQDQGIPNYLDLTDRLAKADGEMVLAVNTKVLKNEAINTKQDATMRLGAGTARMDVVLQPHIQRKNTHTGETMDIYGNVRVKKYVANPLRYGPKNEKYKELSEEIEKNFK